MRSEELNLARNRFFKIRHGETVRSTYYVWNVTHTGAIA